MVFDRFWMRFFATRVADRQSRVAQNRLTENVKNLQISAKICKSQTQAKNAAIKTPIGNLQAAECKQLQQTPIYKIGGGGARAARRIRMKKKEANKGKKNE